MQTFAELHLKPETLAQYGLPAVPATDLKSALLDNGDLPLAVMLHGLQQRSRDGETEWQHMQQRRFNLEYGFDSICHLSHN